MSHPTVDDGDLLFTGDAQRLALESAGLPAYVLTGAPTTTERVLGSIVSFPPSASLTWDVGQTLRNAYITITAEEENDAAS